MRRRSALVAVSAVLVLLAGCGGSPEPASTASASAAPAATSTGAATATAVAEGSAPEVSITSPEDGATVEGDSVAVTLDVENFRIVSDVGGKNQPGAGHVHFYLDVDEIPTKAGEEAVVTGEGRYVATPSATYSWTNVPAGEHVLGAQLVNNNHTPLQPPVTAKITVTVA
jgi:hypothetical protein